MQEKYLLTTDRLKKIVLGERHPCSSFYLECMSSYKVEVYAACVLTLENSKVPEFFDDGLAWTGVINMPWLGISDACDDLDPCNIQKMLPPDLCKAGGQKQNGTQQSTVVDMQEF
ncbi:hypothetical protein E5288_WYG004600 [Bos mutus]|uniref:Uncharacterized protein n=1 Tax=Bos mutus TaxID=72004 RepID=A0A6B0RNG3_9CETA|nr:hypothetical protein [Bos mutus]